MGTSMLIAQLVTVAGVFYLQQPPDGVEVDRKPAEPNSTAVSTSSSSQPMEGFWPSSRLIRLALIRMVEDIGHKYKLDEPQRKKTRDDALRRWERFLKENRAALQPLMNEFLEMRLEVEPPSKQRVQSWARRILPVYEKVQKELNHATKQFRKALNPIQQEAFDLDLMQLSMTMQLAEDILHQWQQGQFDTPFSQEPYGTQRYGDWEKRSHVRKEQYKQRNGGKLPPDHILLELDAWEKYVEQFIRHHRFDEGQRDAARSCLNELKQRALAHRNRYEHEIKQLEQRIQKHRGEPEDFDEIKEQLVRLYGPIDDMFQELQRRVEQIPSARQREDARLETGKLETEN